MKNGFIRVATATPKVYLADAKANAKELASITKELAKKQVALAVFPELALTGATCGDLYQNEKLLEGAKEALASYLQETKGLNLVTIVGLPLAIENKVVSAYAVCLAGRILSFAVNNPSELPKKAPMMPPPPMDGRPPMDGKHPMPPMTRPLNCPPEPVLKGNPQMPMDCPPPKDGRPPMPPMDGHRPPMHGPMGPSIDFFGHPVPVTCDAIFTCMEKKNFSFSIVFGNDLLTPFQKSAVLAKNGANILVNPTAMPVSYGSDRKIKMSCMLQSEKCICAYLYASANHGESTTDLTYGGQSIICENGKPLAKKQSFSEETTLITEVNVYLLALERRQKWNHDCGNPHNEAPTIPFFMPLIEPPISRKINPSPFTPKREKDLQTILSIQCDGLIRRFEASHSQTLILGISGGLDSTLALLVCVKAMEKMGKDVKNVIAITMPCFGTTERTKDNAVTLCEALGVTLRTVQISASVKQHFEDIGHDYSNHNSAFENAQARERTQVLMDIANDENGLVVGTGDLSELALGWATYNGDHMSMYGVNASIPKTLIRVVVEFVAKEYESEKNMPNVASILRDILATPVSPELLPANENGTIAQKTEDLVGPYELHDFFLYYMLRYGASPKQIYAFASLAFENVYDKETIKKWLKIFLRRFFAQQFKRSCSPDGPKVGELSLSPRGDWKMPSDALSTLWLEEAENL